MRTVVIITLALMAAAPSGRDQALVAKPNFSGTWVRDASRSEHQATAEKLVIVQTAEEVKVRQHLCCRQAGEVWTSTYYFGQWGPRRSRPNDQKPTQTRWDGDTLVLHAGPDLDVRGGSVRLWRLAPDGALLEEVINRGLGRRFDFTERAIPRLYTRDRHVYVRSQ